jgi:transposase InsO family protein
LKHRKNEYENTKRLAQIRITEIYHREQGVPGYRMMQWYLKRIGLLYCYKTVCKYMKELGLQSIVRRKKYKYIKGELYHLFPNLLGQTFQTSKPNQVWCTDFTYLQLADGTKRYNCTIIDLYDRTVVASIEGAHITSELGKRALEVAIKIYKPKSGLILHSDQGSQYTSREFANFCKSKHIQQSMSRAGCPYDNAPMERYYNTLKNECLYLYQFSTVKELDAKIESFTRKYNYARPHSHNGGLTPHEARIA